VLSRLARSLRLLPLLSFAVAACAGRGADDEAADQALAATAADFPADFAFGSAIAGFQVDMGCPTVAAEACEDRASDWYQWITTRRIVDNPLLFMSKDPPAKGPGFFELYPKDLALAAGTGDGELANNALRLSIEWSRIFPRPTWGVTGHADLAAIASADGIAFYHQLFAAMKGGGLTPFVTLNHYSLPLWVHDGNACNQSLERCIAEGKGGWADPNRARIVSEIAKYAGFVAEEFGGEVDRWATLNEPFSAVVLPGYIVSTPMRSNPPGLSGPWAKLDGARTAAAAMIEAHARMYDAVKAADRKDADGDGKPAEVGIVYAFSEIVAGSPSPADRTAAEHAGYIFHDMFMDGVAEGRLDENWDAGPGRAPVRPDLAGRLDFVGMNYYFRFTARRGWFPLSFVSPFVDFDPLAPFDATPRGLSEAIRRVAGRYNKPIYITETGTTQDDEARGAAWIVQTLAEVRDARRAGADVRGYFAWSLMDNYEWNQGANTRMGLYRVSSGPGKERTPREAARAFASIAKSRTLDPALEAHYQSFF
jgi:beta-galactosidase